MEEEVAQVLPQVGMARRSIASPRNLAIAVGAAVLLIVAFVFAVGGSDDTKPAARAAEPPTLAEEKAPAVVPPSGSDHEAVVPDDVEIEIPPAPDEGSAAVAMDAGMEASVAVAPIDAGAGSATTTPTLTATPAVSKPRTTINALLKNKDVVLEYDGRIGRNSAPASEQAAIAKARTSHASGTQRLNVGDAEGALNNYRQALSYYPGYIGAYRGMGLAYERKGDKTNALKALRMYVSIVPNANDVAGLRKRIDALSKR